MADLIPASNVFEKLKRVNEHGSEIWSARELARVLEYSEFRHFQPVIAKAREACEKSGHQIQDHFEEILDMVEIGSGAQRQVENWQLSMAAKDIHRRKGLQKKEGILDHMGSTELAANLFRANSDRGEAPPRTGHLQRSGKPHPQRGRKKGSSDHPRTRRHDAGEPPRPSPSVLKKSPAAKRSVSRKNRNSSNRRQKRSESRLHNNSSNH